MFWKTFGDSKKDTLKKQQKISLSSNTLGLREMGLSMFTLSFSGDLERVFLDDYFEKSLPQFRVSMLLAIIIWSSFGLLDVTIVPAMKEELWFIRYLIVFPGLVGITLFSFLPQFKRYMQPCITGVLILGGFGIISMIVIVPLEAISSYYAGLILIFMFGYTFLKARFIWATFAGWILVFLYEIAAIWLNKTPVPVLVNNNFFFINANFIGMLACYSIEFYTRRDFFMARLLESEKEKVKAANLALERRVQERTSQLAKAYDDLKLEMTERKRAEKELVQVQKMEAIGTLAGGIAHDFNNILAAIISYAELGLYKRNISMDKIKYSFDQILQASGRAKDLIKQILAYSRRQEQEKVPVKTGTIVKEALKLLKATLPKHIEIKEQFNAHSDMILADPTQLHQILINLCTNASHAMKENGGILELGLESVRVNAKGEVTIPDLPPGSYLELTVKDTGIGMDASVMERIFDPYFTTKAPGEGTGMGLAVVLGIVKSHGGAVRIESNLGVGSTFHLFFPSIEEKVAEETDTLQQFPTGDECILFIDDEETLVEVGQEMLEEFGYSVIPKTNPTEALAVFRDESARIDLVITDKSMPQMTGFDLAEKIFQIRPDMPVILLTGFSDSSELETAKAKGFKELIMKPINMRDMALTVRRVLDENKQQLPLKRGGASIMQKGSTFTRH